MSDDFSLGHRIKHLACMEHIAERNVRGDDDDVNVDEHGLLWKGTRCHGERVETFGCVEGLNGKAHASSKLRSWPCRKTCPWQLTWVNKSTGSYRHRYVNFFIGLPTSSLGLHHRLLLFLSIENLKI